VGLAAPASSPEDAAAVIAAAVGRWSDARHHCFAWLLADGRSRSSDDGEPGGSAGRPILAQIEGHDLADVAVVVTRWFGGTKLGVGGLIRAYGGCAGKTLDRGKRRSVVPTVRVILRLDYPDSGAVQAILGAQAIEPLAVDWGATITMELALPTDRHDAILAAITDATRGRVRCEAPG